MKERLKRRSQASSVSSSATKPDQRGGPAALLSNSTSPSPSPTKVTAPTPTPRKAQPTKSEQTDRTQDIFDSSHASTSEQKAGPTGQNPAALLNSSTTMSTAPTPSQPPHSPPAGIKREEELTRGTQDIRSDSFDSSSAFTSEQNGGPTRQNPAALHSNPATTSAKTKVTTPYHT